LTTKQVQAITGHTTQRSTDRYTHFDPLEFGDAVKVQAALLNRKNKKKGKGAEKKRSALTIYKPESGKNNKEKDGKAANQEIA
jgi:hypothetical protein